MSSLIRGLVAALLPGDYGWAGALGTYFWIDPKELVAMILMQTPIRPLRTEFPNAVYQAFVH